MKDGFKIKFYHRDDDLLQLIHNNDDQAFTLLYKRYWDPLLNFAAHYLEDSHSCEEIVQELFVQLHARRASICIKSSVSSYLYAALRNKIFNYLRNKAVYKKHVGIAASTRSVTQNNVEQFINLKQLQKEISSSLNRMPEKYKEVYLLHDESHYTIKRISEILNRPVDTVEKQFRKATELLRNHLRERELAVG